MQQKPDLLHFSLQSTSQIHTLFSRDSNVTADDADQWYFSKGIYYEMILASERKQHTLLIFW
jgi:hypothetical protein